MSSLHFSKFSLILMLNVLDDTLIPRCWQVSLPPMVISGVLVCVASADAFLPPP